TLRAIAPKEKYEEVWEGDVTYFDKEGEFRQTFLVTSEEINIKGMIFYQMCSDISGQCVNYEEDFSLQVKANSPVKVVEEQETDESSQYIIEDDDDSVEDDSTEIEEGAIQQPSTSEKEVATAIVDSSDDEVDDLEPALTGKEKSSMIGFMILAFLGGLAALLTPCVFPMIPMTVTFFTGRAKSRTAGVKNALIYGLSIIAIYTLAGTLVAATQGPEFANWLSTHWLPNVFFFLVFIFFALAFLGLFEITLPSSLVNKVDAKGDKGGLTGIFFMAFTLVLVSFSCTGPIVGSILIASAGGEIIQPILGMFAFSLAFAIPFAL